MNRPKYTVLYFLNGPVPTEQDREYAAMLGPNCMFRNAVYIAETDNVEPCVAVFGDATPINYKKAYPEAVAYVAYLQGALDGAPTIEKPDPVLPSEDAQGAEGIDGAAFLPPPPPFAADGSPLPAPELAPGAIMSSRQREAQAAANGWKGNA